MASDTQPAAQADRTTSRVQASTSAPAMNRRPAGGARWIVPAKVAVFIAAWYPLARIVLFGLTDRLGANPIEFITRSTANEIRVEICSNCHPFFTGQQRILDSAGRVERFRRRFNLQDEQ